MSEEPPPVPGAPAPVLLPEPQATPAPAQPPVLVQSTIPAGWEGIMQPGEQILWRGQPIPRPNILRVVFGAAFGALFAGFALFWMVMAARGGGYFWMFGLIHFSVGIGLIAKVVLDERMRLRDTFFTLSTRAAYIARRHWLRGRQLETYPITASMPIMLSGDETTGNVVFANRTVRSKNGSRQVQIGFLDIAGAPTVFARMTQARDALR